MATPFVAGVAAPYAQGNPSVRASRLLVQLVARAEALRDSAQDVGAGLVRAPDVGKTGS